MALFHDAVVSFLVFLELGFALTYQRVLLRHKLCYLHKFVNSAIANNSSVFYNAVDIPKPKCERNTMKERKSMEINYFSKNVEKICGKKCG